MTWRLRLATGAAALAAMSLLVCAQVWSQENAAPEKKPEAQPKQPSPEEMAALMARMEALAKPGPEHKVFEKMVGQWRTKVKMWGDPNGQPEINEGTAEMSPKFEGRYLISQIRGRMMGRPFEGMAIDGYDNLNKRYVSFWIDNFGTGFYTLTGRVDATGKVFTYEGVWDDPLGETTGQKTKKVKAVNRWVNDNKFVMEMYDLVGTPMEFKVMEVEYDRAK